ncbi:MAG: glycosyltransferase family 2 protein [Rickettsiales bacterium]|jgi:hypothetical protein|nr:glycosyltransferase family 2 protein [Rickettsiales bacterium]
MKRIAAITMSRNDEFFLGRWIEYYGRELGHDNLYVYLDGLDQSEPDGAHIKKLAHKDMQRLAGDRYRIGLLSDLASQLFSRGYDIVIGCDTDEFLVVDPATNKSLKQYLSDANIKTSLSGLGLDIGQDMNREIELDKKKPFLIQRGYALLSTRYTKPVVLARPVKWGSGFHKVRGHNFHIDPNLYLLHFGTIDYNMTHEKIKNRDESWKKHMARQIYRTITTITNSKHRRESYIKLARFLQTIFRPVYAWNKPAMLGLKLVTKIPKRFQRIKI